MDYLKKLAANKPLFRRGQTESIELMAAGEFPMIVGVSKSSMLRSMKTGAPIDIIFLDVIPVGLDGQAILKNAPHSNAAKLLLGWLATDGQSFYDEVTKRGIPLPGFNSASARSAKVKTISVFSGNWEDREAEFEEKALKALGRE